MVARKYPSLDVIQIASPCSADWEAMVGDDRRRYCGDCKLHVYNLSDMTSDEALDFISQREGRTCIRMYKRPDGTIITRDCPVGLRAVRMKIVRIALATVGMLAAIAFSALAALGRVPGAKAYLSQGKVDRMRELYSPPPPVITGKLAPPGPIQGNVAVMGGCPAPPMRTPSMPSLAPVANPPTP
jgi:hypothetical protein